MRIRKLKMRLGVLGLLLLSTGCEITTRFDYDYFVELDGVEFEVAYCETHSSSTNTRSLRYSTIDGTYISVSEGTTFKCIEKRKKK